MKFKLNLKIGKKQFKIEFTLDHVFVFAIASTLSSLLIR